MQAPPLAELYDLLRAEGFAIGVDDHVRIGRLLVHEAEWTVELLHASVAALVVTAPNDRHTFDSCWKRWLSSVEPPRPAVVARTGPGEEPSRAPTTKQSAPPAQMPGAYRRARFPVRTIAVAITAIVAAMLVVRSCARRGDSGDDLPGTASGVSGEEASGAGSGTAGSGKHVAGSGSGANKQVAGPASGAASSGNQLPASDTTIDITRAAVVLGTMLLAIAAIAGVLGARARRRFMVGPWRYVLAMPPPARPMLPRNAIEDAAADLTWRASMGGDDLDIARSIAATVEHGGLPTLVHRRQMGAPRYVVLEDTAGGASRWQFIYDELLSGLASEGVELERYAFAANPEHCVRSDGYIVPLRELVDHADALIVIGDGDAAVDPLDGTRAGWLTSLRQVPRRLWINPVPPIRWSAGTHAIAVDTPMEHGVARAIAALHVGVDHRAYPARPYPVVIERTPETASALVALRAALGEPAFQLVSALAMTAPPTIAAAHWLAEVLALELDEQDWLAVATLPWFRAEQWPDGLRKRLRDALDAEAPDLARAVAAISDDLLAASEPPRGSAAHLVWQLEGAERAARRGENTAAVRLLNQVDATPLAHQARDLRAVLGLPDRTRRARASAVAIGVALVIGPISYDFVATRLSPSMETTAGGDAGILTVTNTDAGETEPSSPDATSPSSPDVTSPSSACPGDMVAVPAATFWMGSPDGDGGKDEHPLHQVTLSAYCLDRSEVTVKAYAACVEAGQCPTASTPTNSDLDRFCNGMHADRQDHPINCVDWNQAHAYCQWARRRLPTEAEWEYAARGGDRREYPWGNDVPTAKRLNACGSECAEMAKRELKAEWGSMYDTSDGWETTAPVGSFPKGASPFGAMDMAGNVWEWTSDRYDLYSEAAVSNPSGPTAGNGRVIRGGAWIIHDAGQVRAALRYWYAPQYRSSYVGFRCARSD